MTSIPNWRRWGDACGTAQGLDLVGERWTLLVVREFLPSPQQFADLQGGFAGYSTNIPTERLDVLERSGVERRRTLPAPAASKVYELTGWGTEIGPVVTIVTILGRRARLP